MDMDMGEFGIAQWFYEFLAQCFYFWQLGHSYCSLTRGGDLV